MGVGLTSNNNSEKSEKYSDVVSDFVLSDQIIQEAQIIINEDNLLVNNNLKSKLLKDASRNWDLFYKRNQMNFFKDRKWLSREFPELDQDFESDGSSMHKGSKRLLVDIGSGVGNATIPLLLNNSHLEAICFDCSARAINFLKERWEKLTSSANELTNLADETDIYPHSELIIPEKETEIFISKQVKNEIIVQEEDKNLTSNSPNLTADDNLSTNTNKLHHLPASQVKRGQLLNAFVLNIVEADPFPHFCKEESADIILLLFCLSAINPKDFKAVASRCASLLKPGGYLLFRDYGRYDMAQLRFAKSGKSKIDENFYVRYDGTFAYYFELTEIHNLFSDELGFEEIENRYHLREFLNRKTGVKMPRIWVQAKYRKKIIKSV